MMIFSSHIFGIPELSQRESSVSFPMDLLRLFHILIVLQLGKDALDLPHDYLLLGSAPNLGPLIYRWEIKTVRKLLIQKGQDFRGSKAFVSAIFEFV
jgi:hypothetical protein